jgi:cytoskeletal protein CcmA (bactofilin family)
MNCFSELKYSMYVDHELPTDEARLLEAHLFICPRCRALVDALRVEGHALAHVLQTTEAEQPERLHIGRSLLWTVCSAVALVLVLNEAADWLGQFIPSTAGWLSPFNPSTLISLLFSFSMSLRNASEGVNMFSTIVTAVGALVLGLSSLVGLYLLVKRRVSLPVALFAGLAMLSLMPSTANAIEIRHEGRVIVARNETIDGTLIAAGDTVNIDGTVNGDLIVSGRSINVRGTVKGDVLCASHTLDFRGNAQGSLYAFAQALDLRGTVERNLYGWVQGLQIDNSGRVGNDVIVGTSNGRFSGTVGRDVLLFAGDTQVDGGVGRDFRAYAGDITFSPPGRVGGNLTLSVKGNDHVHLDPAVRVGGKTDIQTQKAEPSRYTRPKFYFWEAVQLAAALITGLLIAWLFPALFRASLNRPSALTALAGLHGGPEGRALLKAAGVGFLVLVATPVAVMIMAFTLVGLPIAILTLFIWLAGLYLAKVFVGALIGQGILKSQAGQPPSFALSLLFGLFVVFVAVNIPYVGGWLNFLVILLGLGIAVIQAVTYWLRSTPSHGSQMALADPSR